MPDFTIQANIIENDSTKDYILINTFQDNSTPNGNYTGIDIEPEKIKRNKIRSIVDTSRKSYGVNTSKLITLTNGALAKSKTQRPPCNQFIVTQELTPITIRKIQLKKINDSI